MKTFITYLLVMLLASQIGCKARPTSFIKTTKEREVSLGSIVQPYIEFVLESKDTIRFGRPDIVNTIKERLAKEIKAIGHVSSKHLAETLETLISLRTDTTVFQNLSAVGATTISDNLDGWIALELLLDGKAEIFLKEDQHPIKQLKYVYVKDILGGEQGSFYTKDKRLVYRTVIALGE